MKKVLHIIPNLNVGGAEADMIAKIIALKDQFAFKVLSLQEKGTLAETLEAEGIEVITGNVKSPKHIFRLIKVLLSVKKWEPELLHAHMFPAYLVAHLARLLGIGNEIVYTIQKEAPRAGKVEIILERWLRPSVKRILTSSKRVLRTYEKRGVHGDNMRYVHNCINFSRFNQSENYVHKELGIKEGPVVGTVGRLLPVKGHRYMVEALPGIVAAHPDVKLVVVGAGPEKEKLYSLAESLAVQKHIHWVGERTDIENFLPYFDVFIMPSLSEAFGIAAAEALACGVPVVGSNVGGISEVVIEGETGLLVPSAKPDLLAEKVNLLLSDSSLSARMGEKGKEDMKRFSSDELAKKWVKAYQ